MSTTPLKIDVIEHQEFRPRDWYPRRSRCKIPFRLLRLCVLGAFVPAILITGPIYLRYRVYSEQLYPVAMSDQRLIDTRISTTWCQRQIVKVNTTFNAYLMKEKPSMKQETLPVSMTRHLILEDDMKEYWGFYLLRGSNVTVSTCVRWPGSSLTIIRGHKHLHECAFIGDDSSEELEEILEVVEEQGLLKINETQDNDKPNNTPERMKRYRLGVRFHQENGSIHENNSIPGDIHHYNSHELDAKAMRNILTELFVKTLETKKKQQEHPHHHYQGVFRETANIDKPPNVPPSTTQPLGRMKKNFPQFHDSDDNSTVQQIQSSSEVFHDILSKITSMGDRGKKVLNKLMEEIERNKNDDNKTLVMEKRRKRRELILSSPLNKELNEEVVQDEDGIIEEGMLNPDGIAEDRGTMNETTLNDRSNSEYWSSFSSSEERLLDCKGLILNLPLTPHPRCTPQYEGEHPETSIANTVTYRVPMDGYYFFVFNSENELQPNYLRVKFDLLKTVYNTSNAIHECKNTTKECSLPFNIFSNERTILELPLSGNDSQWNEEYVVVSICEPRTSLYLICVLMVPLLILSFAFH